MLRNASSSPQEKRRPTSPTDLLHRLYGEGALPRGRGRRIFSGDGGEDARRGGRSVIFLRIKDFPWTLVSIVVLRKRENPCSTNTRKSTAQSSG